MNLKQGLKLLRKKEREESYPKLVKRLDALVKEEVKRRVGYKCQKCGKQYKKGDKNLTWSHYWSIARKGTRWDFDNIDALCWFWCHAKWEHEKQGEYKDYMLKKLGKKKYDLLEIKAHAVTKFSRSDLKVLIDLYGNK